MEARNQAFSTNSLYIFYFCNPTKVLSADEFINTMWWQPWHQPSGLLTLESAIYQGLQLPYSAICGHIHVKAVHLMDFSQPVTECGRNSKAGWTLGDTWEAPLMADFGSRTPQGLVEPSWGCMAVYDASIQATLILFFPGGQTCISAWQLFRLSLPQSLPLIKCLHM